MSDMIERVADAMLFGTVNTLGKFCVVKRAGPDLEPGRFGEIVAQFDTIPEAHREMRRLNARAAIAAMREATPDMVRAGWSEFHLSPNDYEGPQPEDAWRLMVAEALR